MNQLRLLAFVAACALAIPAHGLADGPLTVAESSDYQATSRYDDVMAFCEKLAKEAPNVRLATLGTSHEGRKLPLVIIADPPVANAEEAGKSGKLVFFAMGNIHAGEVDGKEALLAFARDLAKTPGHPWLKDLVFVLAPIFNADGNERVGNNRRSQAGPPEVGVRFNAQELDLNRDFVKLESPEVRALVQFFNEWDPAVFIDMHTTNGSYHRYTLTYEGGRCPAGNPAVIGYVRDKLLPEVTQRMEKASGYRSYFYGSFTPDRSRWETVPPTPRYGIHYVGLRNRLAILSESYSYAPFKDRVLAGKAFVTAIAEHVAENRAAVERLLKDARQAAARAQGEPMANDVIVLRSEPAVLGRPVKILGFVEEVRDGRRRPTAETREYEVLYEGDARPTLTVRRPAAYLLPPELAKVAEHLRRHGIAVQTLRQPIELDVETYRIAKITRGTTFQKHQPVTLEVTAEQAKRPLAAGTFVVSTSQPLGTLAAYLLEPQSADGLATWNFFDEWLKEGDAFPVMRAAKLPAGLE